jgi:dynein light chain LC8-type
VRVNGLTEQAAEEIEAVIVDAFRKFTIEKDIATFIKKEADRKFGPTWHCIVGRNFTSSMTYEAQGLFYCYLEKNAIMIWRAG